MKKVDKKTTKNPGGRPTEYSEEVLNKIKTYLETCGDIEVEKTKFVTRTKKGQEYQVEEKFLETKHEVPTIEGLALFLDVHKDTVYDWAKKYQGFSDLIGKLRNFQAHLLINNGLSGRYNPTIAKVLLTKHGYREGTDITTNDKDISSIKPEEKKTIDDALDAM